METGDDFGLWQTHRRSQGLLSLDPVHFGEASRSSERRLLASESRWIHPCALWINSVHSSLYHLALIVPDDGKHSWLTVAGVKIPWEEGKGILFDDTFEHSARNGAREDRVVLIVDIFRPNLGLVEGLIQKLEVWKRTQDFIAGRQG